MDTKEIMTWLINFWQFHRGFNANMTDLARYCLVSHFTLYRWLRKKSLPKEIKACLIEEWLKKRDPRRMCLNEKNMRTVGYLDVRIRDPLAVYALRKLG